MYNITRVGIIALDPSTVVDLVASARRVLRTDNVFVFTAINGSVAKEMTAGELPLYLRYVMQWGRSDHMEIYSWSSLACLLSHMAMWESVGPNETMVVLEEDAELTNVSAERLALLMDDMRGVEWDAVVLETGGMRLRGEWKRAGKIAATCATSDCTWQGTRGYMVTGRGARMLHRYARPFHVQVDALMGLVATYDPGFRLYWTTADIAFERPGYMSSLWKACMKCYMPAGVESFHALFWVITYIVVGAIVCIYTFKKIWNYKNYFLIKQ